MKRRIIILQNNTFNNTRNIIFIENIRTEYGIHKCNDWLSYKNQCTSNNGEEFEVFNIKEIMITLK